MSTTAQSTPLAFRPIKIGGLTLQTRIVVAPMCTWLSDPATNEVNDKHFAHYSALAMGGAGMVITESMPVEHRGRLCPGDMGIYDDRHVAGLKRICHFFHDSTQTKICAQINHCGRKGPLADFFAPQPHHLGPNEQWGAQCISSSPVSHGEGYREPVEMSRHDMDVVKTAFTAAARRAVEAGFDAVEINAAHGYLLSQWSSPLANFRRDQYGGSLMNRLRYPLEVIAAVRAILPSDMPLVVRISASDWVEGGMTVEDSVIYAREMKRIGVTIVDVSSGGVSATQNILEGWNYQTAFAEKIQREAGIPTMAVGRITSIEQVEELLRNNHATLVALGRSILRDPYWVRNQALALDVDMWKPNYQMAAYGPTERKKAANSRKGVSATPRSVKRNPAFCCAAH